MTVPWSLSIATADRVATTIGTAVDEEAAVTAALFAARDAIDADALAADAAVRYEVRAAGELVALIETGADRNGQPDYVATRALIQRIEWQRYISAAPY